MGRSGSGGVRAHPREMQRRVWYALHSATSQEILDGMAFYEGANGLCRALATVFRSTVEQVAGVYAALSPMNTWDTNVANIVDMFRAPDSAQVNTTHANRRKAQRIIQGEDPEEVLKGRKVRAFYGAILDPSNRLPIPVDRHLICLALGVKIGSNIELRSLVGSNSIYSKIEQVYSYLGSREGVGNRLASIAWFVQRRIVGTQLPLTLAPDLSCCGGVMMSHGVPRRGARRFRCCRCGATKTINQPSRKDRDTEFLVKCESGWSLVSELNGHSVSHSVTTDHRGRRRVYLGQDHPLAYKSGWQWLHRFLVADALGRKLTSDEHVDHVDRDKSNDTLENYRVLLANDHNGYHRGSVEYVATVAEWVDGLGFVEYPEPVLSSLTPAEVPF